MFKFLIFVLSQVSSCKQDCKLYCAEISSTASCLSSCTCLLTSSKAGSYISDYSTWNCSYSIIDACNYSIDFNSCMESANCAYLPSSEFTSSQLPNIDLSYLQSLDSEILNHKENLVVCDDCKVFDGDDYWLCIAEYCKGVEIEGLYKQIKGDFNDNIKLTAISVSDKSLCCLMSQDNDLSTDLCVSSCEIASKSDFDNMKKVESPENLNKIQESSLETSKNPEFFIAITVIPLLIGAGLVLNWAKKHENSEKLQGYYKLT